MKREQDRNKERQRKINRIQRSTRASKRKGMQRGGKSTKLHGGDDWLPRRELKRMVEPPDAMVYE